MLTDEKIAFSGRLHSLVLTSAHESCIVCLYKHHTKFPFMQKIYELQAAPA